MHFSLVGRTVRGGRFNVIGTAASPIQAAAVRRRTGEAVLSMQFVHDGVAVLCAPDGNATSVSTTASVPARSHGTTSRTFDVDREERRVRVRDDGHNPDDGLIEPSFMSSAGSVGNASNSATVTINRSSSSGCSY